MPNKKGFTMEEEEFSRLFLAALNDPAIARKLEETVCRRLSKEMGELREIVKQKDGEIETLNRKINLLENKVDDTEQYSRRNSLRVDGLTGVTDPLTTAVNFCNETLKMDPPISVNSFDRVHQVGPRKEGKERPILMKFANYQDRARVFKARPRLRNSHNRIYVNEDLTSIRAKRFYQLRQMKTSQQIKDCWTFDGRLLVKDNRNLIQQINCEADIDKLR